MAIQKASFQGVRAQRLGKLRAALVSARADALLETHLPNIFYLTGFTGSAGILAVGPRRSVLFTDSRYTIQAREEVVGSDVRICRGSPLAAAGDFLKGFRKLRVAVAPSRLAVLQQRVLRKTAGPAVRWMEREGLVEGIRAVKEVTEIREMREAAAIAESALEEVLLLLRPGICERDVASEIEFRMRRKGASGPSFEVIVASGERSALPHARPTDREIRENELVVLDLGAILRGYCSDITRTVYVGKAPARIRRWYGAVLAAQEAALQTLRPGISSGAVDEAARGMLRRMGLARYFVHSTGHGLGLEVHESPRIGRDSEVLLREGEVVTLEPGIYREGVGGIRIEDDVVLRKDGAERLTQSSRDFREL